MKDCIFFTGIYDNNEYGWAISGKGKTNIEVRRVVQKIFFYLDNNILYKKPIGA